MGHILISFRHYCIPVVARFCERGLWCLSVGGHVHLYSSFFLFPEDCSSQRIFSSMSYDPNPMVQYRKEGNLTRSLKDTSHLPLNADGATPQSHSQTPPFIPNAWISGTGVPILEPESVSECIRKLSQLSSDLYEHKRTIPPLSIHDPDPPGQEESLQIPDCGEYVLEETFSLTQSLIDIYPAFLSTFLNHTSTQTSTPPFSWTDTSSESSASNSPEHTGEAPLRRPRLPLDHSSILLILSCHIRIIEIYESLSKHMEICIRQKTIPMTRRQATLKIPQLAIGTYIPPPSSAVPMQMLLLVQFSSQLFNYAADLASEIEEQQNGLEPSPHEATTIALTRAAVANVKDRAKYMTQELGAMRSLMLHSGMLA